MLWELPDVATQDILDSLCDIFNLLIFITYLSAKEVNKVTNFE